LLPERLHHKCGLKHNVTNSKKQIALDLHDHTYLTDQMNRRWHKIRNIPRAETEYLYIAKYSEFRFHGQTEFVLHTQSFSHVHHFGSHLTERGD